MLEPEEAGGGGGGGGGLEMAAKRPAHTTQHNTAGVGCQEASVKCGRSSGT